MIKSSLCAVVNARNSILIHDDSNLERKLPEIKHLSVQSSMCQQGRRSIGKIKESTTIKGVKASTVRIM